MIDSRSLDDLEPDVKAMALMMFKRCEDAGIKVICTSTLRDCEKQTQLYNQGRTTPGHIVTNAKCGESTHNFKVAFDVAPLDVRNHPIWDVRDPVWRKIGDIGKACGLEWGGDWVTFKDMPHFQRPGVTTASLRAKGMPT